MRLHLKKCERLIDGLYYLIDQRRMNPLQDLRMEGCLAPDVTPTAPLTYVLLACAYILIGVIESLLVKFYVDRAVAKALTAPPSDWFYSNKLILPSFKNTKNELSKVKPMWNSIQENGHKWII